MVAGATARLLGLWAGWVSGLDLQVRIHYPEKNSAVEHCGFRFRVSTSLGDPDEDASVLTVRRGTNLYSALVHLPDSKLKQQAFVATMADFDGARRFSPQCQAVCPDISTQGKVVQLGVFQQSPTLEANTVMDLWPALCLVTGATHTASFKSAALGRNVYVHFRLPAMSLENRLPRPTNLMPPILFRLNAEWYWKSQTEHYDIWHDLMINGRMEPIVIGEVYIENVTSRDWVNQPIYTTHEPEAKCKSCAPDRRFICDSWQKSGYLSYAGGDHHFGSAKAFFAELYDSTIPSVLGHLPSTSDNESLRVGAWGYCIGGLGAWSALTTHPERYNIAYLGSPAMDFSCGEPFNSISAVLAGKLKPRIYIDTGAAEGGLMTGQTALLFQKLQQIGLVEGQDVFYSRAPFGTHQGKSVLRRATKGLLTLFGTDPLPAFNATEGLPSAGPLSRDDSGQVPVSFLSLLLLAGCCASASFLAGRLSSAHCARRGEGRARPLLK